MGNDVNIALAITPECRHLHLVTLPDPELRDDDILVRPLVAGVCGTDLDMLRRQRPETVTVLGHEGIARVTYVGPASPSALKSGDLVIFNPVNPRSPDDVLGHSKPGIFQTRMRVSREEQETGMLVQPDSNIDLGDGPLVEPLGTAIYGQSLASERSPLDTVAVVGAGSIGLINSMLAAQSGCAKLFVLDRSQLRLNAAVRRGIVTARHAIRIGDDVLARVRALSQPCGVDAAFVCVSRAGAVQMFELALALVRAGGVIDLVAGFPDGVGTPALPGVDLNAIRRAHTCGIPSAATPSTVVTSSGKFVHLVGHRGTSREHLIAATRLLAATPESFRSVVTHRLIMADLQALFGSGPALDRLFESGTITKVIVDIQR